MKCIMKQCPYLFQPNSLSSGENVKRASVRMSQYMQAWRSIHPFSGLNNPDATAKTPDTNAAMNQSQMSAVCILHLVSLQSLVKHSVLYVLRREP